LAEDCKSGGVCGLIRYKTKNLTSESRVILQIYNKICALCVALRLAWLSPARVIEISCLNAVTGVTLV